MTPSKNFSLFLIPCLLFNTSLFSMESKKKKEVPADIVTMFRKALVTMGCKGWKCDIPIKYGINNGEEAAHVKISFKEAPVDTAVTMDLKIKINPNADPDEINRVTALHEAAHVIHHHPKEKELSIDEAIKFAEEKLKPAMRHKIEMEAFLLSINAASDKDAKKELDRREGACLLSLFASKFPPYPQTYYYREDYPSPCAITAAQEALLTYRTSREHGRALAQVMAGKYGDTWDELETHKRVKESAKNLLYNKAIDQL